MLMLTRKVDEAIIIKLSDGQQIDVIVTRVDGNQVCIGADADEDVGIFCEELLIPPE